MPRRSPGVGSPLASQRERASQLVILLDRIFSLVPEASGQVDIPSILVSNPGCGPGKYVLAGCTVLDKDVAERAPACVWCAGSHGWRLEVDDGDNILTADGEICRYAGSHRPGGA